MVKNFFKYSITTFLFCLIAIYFVPPVFAASNFTTSNGVIYDDGQAIKVQGVNWFGFESDTHTVHGLWVRNWKEMIAQIKSTGFNAVRIPFCPESIDYAATTGIDFGLNPDLENVPSLEVMDKVLNELDANDMYFILDSHRPDCYSQSGLWYTDSYSEVEWQADLAFLADRYKNLNHFMGVDLKNEPHEAAWGTGNTSNDWKIAAENAGQAVLAKNANLLIIIEGVTNNPDCSTNSDAFWSENLEPVECYPVSTDKIPANKVVFSPHVYGPDVYNQPYFNDSDFPNNMPQIWDTHFGFLVDDGYTLAVGEWGGKYGHGGDAKDIVWQDAFADYMVDKGMCNSFYWSWNPNSGDTGGVLKDDWTTVWSDKVDLLQDYFARCAAPITPEVSPSPSPTVSISPSPSPSASPVSSPPVSSVCQADINEDGKVNLIDYSILSQDFFKSSPSNPRSDINGDEQINIGDYSLLVASFFQDCTE